MQLHRDARAKLENQPIRMKCIERIYIVHRIIQHCHLNDTNEIIEIYFTKRYKYCQLKRREDSGVPITLPQWINGERRWQVQTLGMIDTLANRAILNIATKHSNTDKELGHLDL
jgi:hypothetical protein